MNNPQPQNDNRSSNYDIQRFYVRLTARLCIVFIAITQVISRLVAITVEPGLSSESKMWYALSFPFFVLMSLVVVIEFVLFKKLGPRVVKYSKRVDFILFILYTAEWIMNICSGLSRLIETPQAAIPVAGIFSWTSFGWRTLIMLILVQYWQLQIIPPLIALGLPLGWCIYQSPDDLVTLLLRGITQMTYVILLFYAEDKIKWNMLLANLKQEKWMQINEFILNNIPENIMILDLEGRTSFISDYCKSFLQKCHLSLDPIELFQKVQDLTEQLASEPTSPSFMINIPDQDDRQNTVNILIERKESQHIRNLDDQLTHFKNIIQEGLFKERQFLVYNGKLKVEHHQDKVVEIKLSYIKQFEREHIILILRDTTKRDLLVTLEETNKYKDQLLASVSHELRTPLNGNINLVESAVASLKVPESIKENLLIPALRSSKFLLHLINDILDMSQIKEKKLRLAFQPGDLRETLLSTAQLIELQAKKKEIEFHVELDPNLPHEFCTDHIRLSQIVLNLLNNAIKFTKEGAIMLIAESMKEKGWVKIIVQDSGIGMSQENIEKLFSKYTHIEFEGRQIMNPSGVGLGLQIASNLADLLGPPDGQHGISVESSPGKGSTFTFIIENKESSIDLDESNGSEHKVSDERPDVILPKLSWVPQACFIKTSSASMKFTNSDSRFPLKKSSCSCPQILVVDDNPFNTMAFETILGSLHIRCESVYNGPAAVKRLLDCEKKKCGKDCKLYSMIFMDQEMPEMNGAETVREIRTLQREGRIPNGIKVIGCTAHKPGEEVDKFLEAGLDQCIHKPISAAIIQNTL